MFDLFVQILSLFEQSYFESQFAHTPPIAAHFLIASPSYRWLSFGVKTKTRVSSVFEI